MEKIQILAAPCVKHVLLEQRVHRVMHAQKESFDQAPTTLRHVVIVQTVISKVYRARLRVFLAYLERMVMAWASCRANNVKRIPLPTKQRERSALCVQ